MTVFVAHAPADHETAEALETHLERRGHFAELDDGQTALRPVQQSDVVVLLLSKDFVFAPTRLRLEQRALDAWADGRLILVKLDHGIAPVGLRDLPAVDASFEAQREFKWQEIANSVSERLRAALAEAGPPEPSPPVPKVLRKHGGARRWLLPVLLMAPGIFVLATMRVGFGARDIIDRENVTWHQGFDELARSIGVSSELLATVALGLIALALLMLIGVVIWVLMSSIGALVRAVSRSHRGQTRRPEAVAPAAIEPTASDAVFVSYARANAKDVLPVIEGAKAEGRKFWIDQQAIVAGDGWAGEIVRAIKAAGGVVVMCSKAAFESDHVKREIYLADRYHKKLTPVFIEQAEAPEDFEYFFAGVQLLNLFETPEAERPQALMRALGA